MDRFVGNIAGLGTGSGTRLVIGRWAESPLGAFTDVMMEDASGERTLIAPSQAVADYVSATYSFDVVRVVDVVSTLDDRRLTVTAGSLAVTAQLGAVTVLGRMLRLVPARLATSPAWLSLINPVAGLVMPGVRTAGSAGNGRTEYYGVTMARKVVSATASLDGRDLGNLAPLTPPVRFGFSSAPAAPMLVTVVTSIRRP
ncbi:MULTISPECIES: hypothetical protein [unclassified Arthrobacter]|uniref:hypothetical protein n=1 Tax=unclassified Arthrobacter TaxID=235627 RepID=UPI0014916667|nr:MULTISPECIES: hypothetical protein [unclassified Arthrobacter]MBE0008280.1 hypothetical protein [Arthrobacter sp. AET 35A]NOJ61581.1 hypothetical protein [Arthrobacter sp. 260]NOJ62019.1 hypothetical protein [Arthrobacter sp. 147(2020)]